MRTFAGGVESGQDLSDGRPFVDVTVSGETFRALVDTGSMVNLIGDRVMQHQRAHGLSPCKRKVELRMADGTSCRVSDQYCIEGVIAGQYHSWEALYVPRLTTDVVLGMRCITDLNLIQFRPMVQDFHAGDDEPSYAVDALQPVTADENTRLAEFLGHELPLFDAVEGQTTLAEHTIRLKDNVVPVKQRYYPRNPAMQAIINEEVATMLREGIIEPSSSPWSSPVVLTRKSNGKYRFCIDMRRVNECSIPDAYPLPRINAILEKLRPARYISTLDLKQGYWQVPLAEESRPITAFTVPGLGLFQFTVMPFGLHSAGATFQRLLDKVIGPELEPKVFAYLDDLVVVSSTFDEHLQLLRVVFERLRKAGLRLNPEKCNFCKRELKYLGHVVNSEGISTDPEKVRAIRDFPRPSNCKTLRSFLGLASWYRRFVNKFADVTAPMRTLLKKNSRWLWGPEQEKSFVELKQRLSSAPVLACPDFSVPFVLQVDASTTGLGAALTQTQDAKEVVIAYASRLLTDQEKNYTTTELECLALVWATRKFKPYLEGYNFIAVTDHVALRWLMKLHEPSGRLARWVMELQQYNFEIRYRKGTLNRVADALSRQPVEDEDGCTGQDETTSAPMEVANVVRKPRVRRVEGNTTATVEQPRRNPGSHQPTEMRPDDSERPGWYERLLGTVTAHPQHHRRYQVVSNRLYRSFQRKHDSTRHWKLCVPPEQVEAVLRQNHDDATAGHLGVKKTLHRVGAEYFWPGWRKAVKSYVRSCDVCQRYKVAQTKPAGKMYFRDPKGPWYTVSADLIGPLPRSGRGHRFLLVIQDLFSKWVELCPIGSATAKNVTTKTKEVLLRHGAPETIIVDNGTQFVSNLFKSLAADWDIRFTNTAPYSPQSNPVERANRVVKTMISQFVKENHRSWDLHLGEFQFAINTAVHDSTGHTPAMLTFGRELKVPRAVRGPTVELVPADEPEPTLEEVHAKRVSEFRRIYATAHKNLRIAHGKQARYYNLRRREVKYEIGDRVLRRIHVLSSAADAVVGKLAPKFDGPCEITGKRGVNMYDVKDLKTQTAHVVHDKDLKSYHDRSQAR